MKYLFGLDECYGYKCDRLIQEGEHKLRVTLALEQVTVGESIGEILETSHIPIVSSQVSTIHNLQKDISTTMMSILSDFTFAASLEAAITRLATSILGRSLASSKNRKRSSV